MDTLRPSTGPDQRGAPSEQPSAKQEKPPEPEHREMAKSIQEQLQLAGYQGVDIDTLSERLTDPARRPAAEAAFKLLQRLGNKNPVETARQRQLLFGILLGEEGETVRQTFHARVEQARTLEGQLDALLQGLDEDDTFNRVYAPRLRGILTDINMPDPEQRRRRTAYMVWGGRPSVDVARLHEHQRALDGMTRSVPLNTPEQQAYVQSVRQLLQGAIVADPRAEAAYQWRHPQKAYARQLSEVQGSLRMLGLLVVSGLAIVTSLIDMKNQRFSYATMAYIGLAAGLAGAFRGKEARQVAQLSFLTNPSFERLVRAHGIRGREWADIVEALQTNHGLVRELRAGGRERIDKIAEGLRGRAPAVYASISAMSTQDLLQLATLVRGARSQQMRGVVRQFIISGAGPESLNELTIPS